MPQCPQCQRNFSRRVVIDGKARMLSKRRYCLTCSPFGAHNTKRLHEATGPDRVCMDCQRSFTASQKAGHRGQRCNSCVQRRRRQVVWKIILDVMGPACWICGYRRSKVALHQHHIEPSTKLFAIAGCEARSEQSIRTELAKCAQLCANCHVEAHEGLVVCPLARS